MNNCLVCSSPEPKIRSWNQALINTCNNCSFAWINFESQDDDSVEGSDSSITTAEFYDQTIIEDSAREILFADKILTNRLSKYNKFLGREVASILEVGCGTGATEKGFTEHSIHWLGVELNQGIHEFCKSKKRNVLLGDFLDIEFNKKFDVIYASQVLEHINQPKKFIQKCQAILNDGGLIHVDVPNHDSLVSNVRKFLGGKTDYGALRPPEHMRAYSQKSLDRLFTVNGLQTMTVEPCMNDDFTFGQLVVNIPLAKKIFFFIQQIFKKQSLLVGVAKFHSSES
jgi:SAM-dependent methyltransferase